MAEIETVLAPAAKKDPVVDHYHMVESVHSLNDEKSSPSNEHDHKHKDNLRASETEGLSDVHNPNVYVEARLLNSLPINTNLTTSRSDPFPVDPNAPEEIHQLTVRALVVGGILGAIGTQIAIS
jgi:hypothetical protein